MADPHRRLSCIGVEEQIRGTVLRHMKARRSSNQEARSDVVFENGTVDKALSLRGRFSGPEQPL
jgi:hypothetical protein